MSIVCWPALPLAVYGKFYCTIVDGDTGVVLLTPYRMHQLMCDLVLSRGLSSQRGEEGSLLMMITL